MSISEIMADPKIRDYYLGLDISPGPIKLADKYLSEKLAGNSIGCAAIEHHLRELAKTHFHVGDVLQGLSDMERHKKRRKMGKSAPKMLKEIGAYIRAAHHCGDFHILDDGRIEFWYPLHRAMTSADLRADKYPAQRWLKIRCKNAPGSIELVACKYERGLPKR